MYYVPDPIINKSGPQTNQINIQITATVTWLTVFIDYFDYFNRLLISRPKVVRFSHQYLHRNCDIEAVILSSIKGNNGAKKKITN